MNRLTELQDQIERLAGRGPAQRQLGLPGLSVMRSTGTTHPGGGVSRPTMALTAAGAKLAVLGEQPFEYHAGEYLISTLDLPITSRITQADPYLAVGLAIRPELIAELVLGDPTGPHRKEAPGMGVAAASPDLLDAVLRLLRLTENPTDSPVLAAGLEREIHWRLLTGPLGSSVRQIGLADSRISLVGRATRWITERFDQVIRIDELAAFVGVSVPTLNRSFRAVTAMSPLQYQKQIRLQGARVQLMSAPVDVAAVGYAVGYDSPSQFSREYRRLFGAPPGQDAQRLQSQAAS